MDWWMWIGGYLIIGSILLQILWKTMKIKWGAEATDTKLILLATPVFWPLVLIFVASIWIKK